MSKRRLSIQQKKRIAKLRRKESRSDVPSLNDGNLKNGLVVANYGSEVTVQCKEGNDQRCFVRANLDIVTGDRVLWREDNEHDDQQGVVEAREERDTEIHRPDIYGKLRTVAANVSQMLITIAPVPEAHASMIDRYLVAAYQHKLDASLVFNKCDLASADDQNLNTIRELYTTLGINIIEVSAHTGEGVDQLKAQLQDQCSIFVGQSGVGKSSLISSILPEQDILVGALSEGAGKGKHTTTLSRLYNLPDGGQCIDSPGIREFGLWHVEAETLINAFHEIAEHAQYCKFRDCAHNSEPGCAVKQALEDGKISAQRFQSYQSILNQLDDITIQTTR